MPDAGENEADEGKHFPSDLSKSTAIKKTADGTTYLYPRQFHRYFAADLSAGRAAFMARSQVLNTAENFRAVITSNAGTQPEPKSHKAEVSGTSHSVYVSRSKEVAA
jgi:hypothetical protein